MNDQETPKFSMEDIRTKLSTLYDIDILNEQALAMDDKPESDSEEDTTNAIIDFSLPYHEYMQIIEDHGREESESIADSAIDPKSSPTASMRTDSQMPDSEEDQTPSIPAKRGRKPKSSPKSKPRTTGNRKSTRKK